MLQKLQRRSLRTGTRFGQASWDVVSQKAQLSELPLSHKGITQFPVLGKIFEESIQINPGSVPPSAVIMPDTKVIYFPFEAAPGGAAPHIPSGGMTYEQTTPSSTWTIHHTLGYDPAVTTIVDNEEVEAEVDFPNLTTVVITFTSPQAGIARLT